MCQNLHKMVFQMPRVEHAVPRAEVELLENIRPEKESCAFGAVYMEGGRS